MKSVIIWGCTALLMATAAAAQTNSASMGQPSDQSRAAKEQQSQKQPCNSSDTSNVNCKQSASTSSSSAHSSMSRDQSRSAKEQQSQRKTCTGDNSNVNCKQKGQ
jgi:hypothetical protein